MKTDPPKGVRSLSDLGCRADYSGNPEVSATRENQGADGTECDHDSTHYLHVDSLPPPRGKALSHFLINQSVPRGTVA